MRTMRDTTTKTTSSSSSSSSSSFPSSSSPSSVPICIVTGGSNGIGLAIVEAFLSNGMRVFNFDVVEPSSSSSSSSQEQQQEEATTKTKNQLLTFVSVDVSNAKELSMGFKNVWDTHQRIDCVVNNAGIFECQDNQNIVWDDTTTIEQINRMVQTNLLAVIHGTRIAYHYMKQQQQQQQQQQPTNLPNRTTNTGNDDYYGCGCIVNIASTDALSETTVSRPVYGSTKHAILHFSRTAKLDLQPTTVRVFCICPGIIDTEMGRMGGEPNRQAVAKLKHGKRTSPKLVAEAVLDLVFCRIHKEWQQCSYLLVDNHEITPIYDDTNQSLLN